MNMGMPTKPISLEIDAYDKLRLAKRHPRESFSEVVRRLPIPARGGVSGRELLAMRRETGPLLDDADLEAIDALNRNDSATALANDLPVVTHNDREFERVRGLNVYGY